MNAERPEVPAPLRSKHAIFLLDALLLAAILALAAGLRFARLGADPPLSLSASNAEVMDGGWYFARAADTVRHQPTDVPPQYEKPVLTGLGFVAFAAGGVSLEAAHAAEAALGVLLVLAGALAAWWAYGTRTALVAGLFLATAFPLVGYARVPLIYGPLATALTISFFFFVIGLRLPIFHVFAWAALAAAALGLKQTAVALAPALAAGQLTNAARRGRAAGIGVGLALLAGTAIYYARPAAVEEALWKATGYLALGPGGPLAHALEVAERLLKAPVRSGLALEAFPLLAIAWAGVLVACARHARREGEAVVDARRDRASDTALVLWLVATVVIHGLFRFDPQEGADPPLRHFAPALVPAAILAARTLVRLAGGVEMAAPRAAIALWALPAAYAAIAAGWRAAFALAARAGRPIPASEVVRLLNSFPAYAAGAALFAALAALVLGRRFAPGVPREMRISRPVLVLGALAALASDAAYLAPALARPTYTLRAANRATALFLSPGASLAGPFAHALTWEVPSVTRHHFERLETRGPSGLLVPRAKGYTHLAVDAAWGPALERIYEGAGEPLVRVATLEVRGYPVRIYRFSWAENLGYTLSFAERRAAREAPP